MIGLKVLNLNKIDSKEKNRVLKEGKNIIDHRFEILSKPIKFGKKINWRTNFSKKSWPIQPYLEFRANNYDFDSKRYIGDIKLPWELNKHLYLQDLAKAYLLTSDEKYAQEFVYEINDWLEENPYEIGVNWTEGLIASHRAISWVIALGVFSKSKLIKKEFLKKITDSLFQHVLFIEKTYEFCARASNHLLGELCAQIVLSICFPEFEGSQKRLDKAIKNLEKELNLQVYPDGVDYEMSLSYQRVILEFLYLPLILAKRKLVKLPQSIWQTAEKMTEFMMHMTQPNGLLQPISDADGARVFILGNDINDFRPHLALASWLFNRGDFKYVSENKIDPIIWFLSDKEYKQYQQIKSLPPKETSRAFREGGYWTTRSGWKKDSDWMFFDCGYMGMGKWPKDLLVGVHGHSDTLNFGLCLGGETFLTDNGSYSYTTERPFHQYFRSSRAHNVAIVDDHDQNVIENKPWLTFQHALPQNVKHYFSPEIDYLSGEHTGYLRLPNKIIARREIVHFKSGNFIIIKDSFLGEGRHKITENFHLMPGLKVQKKNDGYLISGKKHQLLMKLLFGNNSSYLIGKTKPVDGWYVPNYGKKLPAGAIKYSFMTNLPSSHYFVLNWGENKLEDKEMIELFETTYQKIKKPKIIMLISNNLQNDPRVQKEAFSAAKNGFDVSVLAFSTLDSQRTFSSDEFEVKHIIYEPQAAWQNIRRWLGHKVMSIYFQNKYFALMLSPLGKIKNYLRSKTLNLIDNDINQPVTISSQNNNQVIVLPKSNNPLTKFWIALNYFKSLNKKFISEAVKCDPDIIHAHDLDTLLAGYLINRKTGAKLIYDSHELWTKQGMPIPKIFIWFMGLLERWLIKKVDGLISVNESILEELKNMYHFKPIPQTVVYNCPKYFKTILIKKPSVKIKILYQGRFAPNRGLEELVLASRYFKKNVELYFRCTGEEDIKQKIYSLVKKYKLEKRIFFLKPVAMEDLSRAARFADIGIIPYLPTNRNNELASPNKLFEYSMAGLAIACSHLVELRKFVKAHQNGLLFKPEDPKSIARVINRFAEDHLLLAQSKENSIKAAKEYNWEKQAEKLIDLYKNLLKKEH